MHKVSKSPLKVPVKADQLDGKKVKAKPKRQPKKIAPVADSENDDNPSPSNARLSGADSQDVGSNPKAPAKPSSGEKDTTTGDGEASESERSIIIDETPKKRKRKIKEPDESQKQPKEKKQKKGAVQLSKDEETVKRLKAIVYACGVRKVWSKEFQNIDKPSQQIKKIKDVIAELGMNGRPTLEKAKAIKAKRELAKELEDVRAFGEAHASQSEKNRSKQGSTALASSVEAEGASDNDSINEEVPPRKKKTAWQSISAFLDDQSDEE
ncbi:hypothetical protein SERLA73DRAFT_185250 [Serpula lacrymans var. lacrymans S7.3]|uniref:Uncharacterized protein n=2 Tax=Serpula lacrymans var. lacrymans TaxID=341189 RepID=F8Q4D5_SERL3|nr:hypothetical protein SERLA73DRAFT_185250 [Serpula lacrymans var. lacrymans S7.3]